MGIISYQFHVALYTALLLFVSLIATFIGVVANLCGKRYNTNYYVARTFWHITGPILGWKFDVSGEEHFKNVESGKQPAVILGNHQSAVDILYLGRMFPKRAAIMAKKELKWIPGLGWFMMLSGSIFINRSNNKSAVQLMTQAGEEMNRKKLSLFIFPEGTRHLSNTPDLLPFKKGAFHLAIQSGCPIIPVVVENYSKLLKKNKYFKRGTLKMKILEPIPTTGMTTADVNELIEKTRTVMLATLKEMSASAVPEPDSPLLTGTSKPAKYDAVDDGKPTKREKPAKLDLDSEDGEGGEASASTAAPAVPPTPEDDDDDATEVASQVTATEVASTVTKSSPKSEKLTIAMVSDFFHPDIGGVEGHIYSLGVELMRRGHKVIVVTHHHKNRVGIRWLAPGLKVYHVPHVTLASSASLPNYLLFLPYIRTILLRERVDIVHGHATLSSLAHEAIHHAPLFGVRTCFTDHSLFGFADAVGVLTNKLLASALRNVDAVVCVSNTGRENTALRAEIEPERVSVIPNALVPSKFRPDPERASKEYITIVVIARLVYRKGIDLLVSAAPTICDLFPDVRFVVGGDGPKMVDLLQVREKYELQDRIELLGAVRPADVRGLLTRGHIYLNTSLTEAFGISIIEAASAGLFVVSTRVGGVPEILPADMIEFARADEDDVIRALSTAIHTIRRGAHSPEAAHARVADMYSWAAVAERTEEVYMRILATPAFGVWERLMRLAALGPVMGVIMCCIMAVQFWWLLFVEWVLPETEIDVVPRGWDQDEFVRLVEREKREAKQRDMGEES